MIKLDQCEKIVKEQIKERQKKWETKNSGKKNALMKFIEMLHRFAFYIYTPFNK